MGNRAHTHRIVVVEWLCRKQNQGSVVSVSSHLNARKEEITQNEGGRKSSHQTNSEEALLDVRIHLPVELVHALLPNLEVSATELPNLEQVIQVVVATIGGMVRSPDESTQLIIVNRKRSHVVRLESKGRGTSYLPRHAIALLCDWNRSEHSHRDIVL